MITWNYSAVKCFTTCALQYKHRYIIKDVPYVETDATRYGKDVHKAIENFFKDGTPLPPQFVQFAPQVEAVARWPGQAYPEYKMALNAQFEVCDYWDRDFMVRGAADLIKVSGNVAHLIDWKTGGNAKYADIKQLELMALMIFKHFPQVQVVKGGLVFMVANRVIKATFKRQDERSAWLRWMYEVSRIEHAVDTGRFDPNPSGLCKKSCDVLSCPHNGRMLG